jgi:hypothetical protein
MNFIPKETLQQLRKGEEEKLEKQPAGSEIAKKCRERIKAIDETICGSDNLRTQRQQCVSNQIRQEAEQSVEEIQDIVAGAES